jgi:quercetin dioxygenase-like cupin family protein
VNKVRRVVTGTSERGQSIVTVDESLEAVTVAALPGYGWASAVGLRHAVTGSYGGHCPTWAVPLSAGGRHAVHLVHRAARRDGAAGPTREQRLELEEKLPGRGSHMESDQGGMHRTQTIDLVYVVRGEIALELDDGVTVYLATGDAIVQHGTRHAWRNTSKRPCTMVVVLLGTELTV